MVFFKRIMSGSFVTTTSPENSRTDISSPDMFSALSKPRSRSFLLQTHMKFVLLVVIGALVWTNDEARTFTADVLQDASEVVRPEPKSFQERINYVLK